MVDCLLEFETCDWLGKCLKRQGEEITLIFGKRQLSIADLRRIADLIDAGQRPVHLRFYHHPKTEFCFIFA